MLSKQNYTKFRETLLSYLRDNAIVFLFVAIILSKIFYFSVLNDLMPSWSQLGFFILYNFCTVSILIVPALFISKRKAWYLMGIDILFTLILLGDTAYLRFFNTLPIIGQLRTTSALSGNAGKWLSQLFSPFDLFLIFDFTIFALSFRYKKIHEFLKSKAKAIRPTYAIPMALVPFIILTVIISIDAQGKLPYLYSQISENKVAARDLGVLGAHILDASRDIVEAFDKVTPAEQKQAFDTISANTNKLTPNAMTAVAKDKRIIMIQVESLDNFLIGKKLNEQEITPNLNKLSKETNYFADDYFTLGAGGTSDADFSVNTSLYPLTSASAFVEFGKDNFTSLEKELKNVGYTTNAYHANSRGYWNRSTALKSLGFDNFFAQDNYQKGETINMGLSDKDFLNQSFEMMKAQPTQSLDYLITLSSHFSFEMPDKDKSLNLGNGKYTSLTASYLQVIHYTDSALGEFLQKLKDAGMYDDSLIVLYGDHTAKYDALTDDSGNRVDLNSTAGKRIPLFIKLPGQTVGEKHTTPSSHLDIMPTLLNLVGANPTSPMFGKDLFGKTTTFFFTSSAENNFEQIISGSLKYLNNNTDLICSKYTKGKPAATNLSTCNPLLQKRNQIQDAIDLLIKHNLFAKYLAR